MWRVGRRNGYKYKYNGQPTKADEFRIQCWITYIILDEMSWFHKLHNFWIVIFRFLMKTYVLHNPNRKKKTLTTKWKRKVHLSFLFFLINFIYVIVDCCWWCQSVDPRMFYYFIYIFYFVGMSFSRARCSFGYRHNNSRFWIIMRCWLFICKDCRHNNDWMKKKRKDVSVFKLTLMQPI